MKTIIILLGAVGLIQFTAGAQNNQLNFANNTINRNSGNSINSNNTGTNNNANTKGVPYVNPNYDHSPNYYQLPYTDPHKHYLQIDENQAPVNNVDNNNTMTPYNNTTSPYDITSPYYTPPNTNAPLNNIPPIR